LESGLVGDDWLDAHRVSLAHGENWKIQKIKQSKKSTQLYLLPKRNCFWSDHFSNMR
jgi:hypothetical protein